MKTFLKIFCLAALVASCDDVEPTIFHGDDPSNVTLLSFSSDVYSLPIERDANGLLAVAFNASTVSNSDRTFNIEVIPGTANAATYSVPASVTIPAGQYQGILNITGQDNNLVDEDIKNFTIRIPDTDFGNESLGFTEAIVRVYEVCPLLAEFTGSYRLEVQSSMFSNAAILANSNVELNVGSNPYERVFKAKPYPDYLSQTFDFIITFQCDYLNLGSPIVTGLSCGEEIDGDNTFAWGPTENPSTYTSNDDSEFFVTFSENITSACQNGPVDSSFKLTKN